MNHVLLHPGVEKWKRLVTNNQLSLACMCSNWHAVPFLVQYILSYPNTFVHGRLGNCSDKWIKWNRQKIQSTSQLLWCASYKNRFLPQHWPAALHLALATHQSSIISFSSCPCWPFLFEKLSSLSTSVAFRIGCIRSYVYELAFSSIVNTFSVLSIAVMIGRHHLSKFRNCYDPLGFCKYECGLWNFTFG